MTMCKQYWVGKLGAWRFLLMLLTLMPIAARAQTSIYSSMTVAGVWQGWNPGANNLRLTANNTWQGDFFIPSIRTNEFKFAANGNWSVNWGSNVTVSTLPYNVSLTQNGQNIKHVNVADGYYRFTFNDATKQFTLELLGYSLSDSNRARNASFEIPGATNTTYDALHWKAGQPDNRSGNWGSSSRQNFRAFTTDTGTWQMIVGTTPNFGGVYQDHPAGEGFEYEASGSFWADVNPPYGPWTAAVQELKIEFFNPAFSQLGQVSTNLNGVIESWKSYSVRGIAPPGTAWARMVVNVNGAGNVGSLQFDQMSFIERPPLEQSFNEWRFASYTTTHARAGWQLGNGSTLYDPVTDSNDTENTAGLVYSAVSAKLNTNGYILTPYISNGAGRLLFYYRSAYTNSEDTTNAIAYRVSRSSDAISFTTVRDVTNVVNLSYQQASIRIDNPDAKYLRIEKISGPYSLMIDDISILPSEPVVRYQDFSEWTNNVAFTNHTVDEWILSTGRVITNGGFDDETALIKAGATTNEFNYLQSPLFTNGYGSISFYYARGTNGSGAAELWLQSSTNGSSWTTLAILSNVVNNSYNLYNQFFFNAIPSYIRIVNRPIISGGGGPGEVLIIDEPFNGGSTTPPSGWTFTGMGQYTSDTSSGRNPPSLQFNSTGDQVITPEFNNGTNLSFMTKGNSVDAGSWLEVAAKTTANTNFSVIAIYTNLTNNKVTRSETISTNVIQLRFTYTKSAGNLAFDDLIIRGKSAGGPATAQELKIDNVNIGPAAEYRTQNFDSWPTKTGYTTGTDKYQGWSVGNTIVDSQNTYLGQVGRMNTGGGPFIQSHHYPDGYGTISFLYRSWNTSASAFDLQYSTNNGVTWSNLQSFTSSTTNYVAFSKYYFFTNGAMIRLVKTSGVQALIDQIEIGRPSPPADVVASSYITPEAPFTNDSVYINAQIFPINGTTSITATAYYRIGTNGGFTAIAMSDKISGSSNSTYGTWQSVTSIPPKSAGTIVQYYVRVDFSGPGSNLSGPRFVPATATNLVDRYAIPRAKPGQVWINEVNYDIWSDAIGYFIEIAGPTGFNLGGWKVELRTGGIEQAFPSLVTSYGIPNPTILPSDTSLVGFWVLGDNGAISGKPVPNRDMDLTNQLFDIYPLGILLKNEAGGVEQAISIDGTMFNYDRIFATDTTFATPTNSSIALTGSGTGYTDFVWTDYVTNASPGAVNSGQVLGALTDQFMQSPDLYAISMSNGFIYIQSDGNTNGWTAAPYFTQHLVPSPQNWQAVTPYSSSTNADVNRIWFAVPTNQNIIYRIWYQRP